MAIFLLESLVYLVLGIQSVLDKWNLLTVAAFAGLLFLLVSSLLIDARVKGWAAVLAVLQMLCGVAVLAVTPPVLLQGYLPVATVHILLGFCSLFMNAELQDEEKPRLSVN